MINNKKRLALKLPKSTRRLRFSRHGRRYALLMIAILLAALNTGNNLLYLILSFMLSTIIFSRFIIHYHYKNVQVSLQVPEDIHAKKQFLLALKVKNNKNRISLSPQELQFMDGIELSSKPFIPQIKPGHQFQCKLLHTFNRRGIYKLKNLISHSTYPLGIYEHFHKLPIGEREIVVYPTIKPLKDFYVNGSLGHKALESFISGGSFSLYNIRDYIPGDEARFLHWKASAKLSKLMIKEFVQEEQKKVTLLLDTSYPDKPDVYSRKNFEDKISLAASLLYHFISHDYSVRLVTSGETSDFGWGALHLHNMLKHLALVEADNADKPDLVELCLRAPESPFSLTIVISYRREKLQFSSGRQTWYIDNIELIA